MELGVGEALVSVLDDAGVPGVVQRTAIICPQSLMAPCSENTRCACVASDGMGKYDTAVDNDSAYEVLERQRAEDERQAQLDAEREAFEKEKAAFEAQKRKEEELAEKKRIKEEEAAEKRRLRELEKQQAAYERSVERRRAQIERQVINTGAQVLRRGLMNTLFGGKKK